MCNSSHRGCRELPDFTQTELGVTGLATPSHMPSHISAICARCSVIGDLPLTCTPGFAWIATGFSHFEIASLLSLIWEKNSYTSLSVSVPLAHPHAHRALLHSDSGLSRLMASYIWSNVNHSRQPTQRRTSTRLLLNSYQKLG